MLLDVLTALGALLLAASLLAWTWPWARRQARGWAVRAALLPHADGRHAVAVAREVVRMGSRVRRAMRVAEPDAGRRAELERLLERFTGVDVDAVLQQMRLLLATGDNDRIRQAHRQLQEHSQRWAALGAGPERARLEEQMAAQRQELERSQPLGRQWVSMLRGLEESAQAMRLLERELLTLDMQRRQPLGEFTARLQEACAHLRRVREAHQQL